jgi:hypothetical protein
MWLDCSSAVTVAGMWGGQCPSITYVPIASNSWVLESLTGNNVLCLYLGIDVHWRGIPAMRPRGGKKDRVAERSLWWGPHPGFRLWSKGSWCYHKWNQSSPERGLRELSHSFCHVRTHPEGAFFRTSWYWHLILVFQWSKLFLRHPVCGTLLYQPGLTKTDTS